jgi:hypothetical protein
MVEHINSWPPNNNSMNSDWEKLRRFAIQLSPTGYAERCADARGDRSRPVGRPPVVASPCSRRLAFRLTVDHVAAQQSAYRGGGTERRGLGPLARSIPRLEPAVPSASALASRPAAQPPPRWPPRQRLRLDVQQVYKGAVTEVKV